MVTMDDYELDLSVIIVSWNVRKLLDDCLNSVYLATRGLKTEIYVVDNASTDGSQEMVARNYPDIVLIINRENLGFGRANNQALRMCRGKYTLLLNPDTLIPEDSIHRMVTFMETHRHAGLVGPAQYNEYGGLTSNIVHFHTREWLESSIERLVSIGQHQTRTIFCEPRLVPMLNAGCWLTRTEVIRKIGLFDERFFMYGEEPDVCYRMSVLGWQIWYLRDVKIIHYRCQSILQRGKIIKLQLFSQSMFQLLKKFSKNYFY